MSNHKVENSAPTELDQQNADKNRREMRNVRHSIIGSLLDHARANGGSIEPHKLVTQAKALSAWIMNGTMPKPPAEG